MNRVITSALALGGTAAAVGAVSAVRGALGGRGPADRDEDQRWLGVTVLRPQEEVAPGGEPPEPLRRLGEDVEVRLRPAPGDRGTELYARPRSPGGGPAARVRGEDPRQQVREALREAKSLLEAGEVVRPDAPPTTHPGPAGKLLQQVTRIANREGRL